MKAAYASCEPPPKPPLTHLIEGLVERHELDRAERLLANHGPASAVPEDVVFNLLLRARAALRLAQGRLGEALDDLVEYGRRESDRRARCRRPVWDRHAGQLGADEPAESHAIVEAELCRARALSAVCAVGIALRAAGLVEGGEQGINLLREAVAVLERSGSRPEHARALIDLGAALRRANRRSDAREPLTVGLEVAERCGATAVLEQASEELKATRSRPRRAVRQGMDSLTPSERRIARLAVDGKSNGEIAQSLFVTRKTVEMHLSNAYRKLDIRSRAELAEHLDGARPAVPS